MLESFVFAVELSRKIEPEAAREDRQGRGQMRGGDEKRLYALG